MKNEEKKSRYFAILLYPDNELHCSILGRISNSEFNYIGIWHEGLDGGKRHAHVFLAFDNPRRASVLAAELGFPDDQFCRALFGQFSNSLLYLVHANSPDKEQYTPSDLFGSPSMLKRFDKVYIRFLRSDVDMSDAVQGCLDWMSTQSGYISYIAFARWACSSPYFKGAAHPLCRLALEEHNARERSRREGARGHDDE